MARENNSANIKNHQWQSREMLIWGKTYPQLSKKYTETVCTGAVFTDRPGEPGLIRIYPIDFRYLDDEQEFPKWTIIRAEVKSNPSDPRPESFKINSETIEVVRHVDTSDGWEARIKPLLRDEHLVSGLEEMQDLQKDSGRSIGIVGDIEVRELSLETVSNQKRREWREKYEQIVSQEEFWSSGTKPVPLPKARPRITFKAPGDSEAYDRLIIDWEAQQLANRCLNEANPSRAFEEAVMDRAFNDEKEPYLVLGNLRAHPHTFVVGGIFYPDKQRQTNLL